MIENGKVYVVDPTEQLYYIFVGLDLFEDENSFLNYSNTLNKYFIDSRVEGETTKTKFTYSEFVQAKKDLPNLWFGDEGDCLITVEELDD